MSRLMTLLLVAGLAGLTAAGDAPPIPAKLPKFKDHLTVPDPISAKLKAVDRDTLTVVLPEYTFKQTSRKRPPTVKAKNVEHTLTLHAEALVRWSRKPDRRDDKGKLKPYTVAEMKILQAPVGAPGYLGDKQELLAGQTVEITLLVPAKILPENLTEDDYRIKWVVIQGSPTDAKPKK